VQSYGSYQNLLYLFVRLMSFDVFIQCDGFVHDYMSIISLICQFLVGVLDKSNGLKGSVFSGINLSFLIPTSSIFA